MKIWMKFKKATKNKFVFEECDEMGETVAPIKARIAGLYLAKNALDGPAQHITVTIDVGMALENVDA